MEKFLNYIEPNLETEFLDIDDEKSFRKKIKKMPYDWVYRNKKIIYKTNEYGFRTKSFNEIDWANSIVVFGDSDVFGLGLAEENTIPYQLEQILNVPVVNLGIYGSANDINCWNSLILHEHYPKPKAIVHHRPSLYRYSDFDNGNIIFHLPKSSKYNFKINWEERSKFYIRQDRALWKDKLPFFETTYKQEISLLLNVHWLMAKDTARDLNHPGIESAKIAAKIIAKNLKMQGLQN